MRPLTRSAPPRPEPPPRQVPDPASSVDLGLPPLSRGSAGRTANPSSRSRTRPGPTRQAAMRGCWWKHRRGSWRSKAARPVLARTTHFGPRRRGTLSGGHRAGPERGCDDPHVRLEQRGDGRRTAGRPVGEGGESVGRDHACDRRSVVVGHTARVERVERRGVVGRSPSAACHSSRSATLAEVAGALRPWRTQSSHPGGSGVSAPA